MGLCTITTLCTVIGGHEGLEAEYNQEKEPTEGG